MNTILQKRIEEAAEASVVEEIPPYIPGDFVNDSEVECAYERAQETFIAGANFALQNQWISVEEALPEEDIPNCFVTYKAMDMVLYSTGSYEKGNKEWYVDGVGFNAEVTHYMPIPSLEGG